ncbi:hypothetical protein ACFSCV_19105 [Methylopila henanensis]|uniref:Uncharacterized protein n=1 Tax=Methylopila henanensis TaxID=873516 RepID=A0ABW4KAZ1_9HYPH
MNRLFAALAIVSLTGPVYGQTKSEPPGVNPPSASGGARAAPTPSSTDRGMALMSARVLNTGALLGGAGVESSVKAAAGIYYVTFGRDLTDCASVATSTNAFDINYAITTYQNTLTVYSYRSGNQALQNSDFSLITYCDR